MSTDTVTADTPVQEVEVRRNGVLFAVVGTLSALLALAYLVRALGSGGGFAWVSGLLLGALGVAMLVSWLDSRTPLLVADTFGIRLRLGGEWRGLPWDALEQVVVEQGTSVMHDGRLVVVPAAPEALADLDGRGRRLVTLTRRVYGAPLVVPLGMTTTVSVDNLVDALADLSAGRSAVVELAGWTAEPVVTPQPGQVERREARVAAAAGHLVESRFERNARPFEGLAIFEDLAASIGSGMGSLVSRAAHGRDRDVDAAPSLEPRMAPVALRVHAGERVHAVVDAPDGRESLQMIPLLGSAAPQLDPIDPVPVLPEAESLRREDSGWDIRDERMASAPEVPDPALTASIGPRLLAARTAVGYGLDALSERTRIRPHVIEAMEADDFTACGGDFYARGHLRSVAEVLGLPAADLVAAYDAQHATAAANAERLLAEGDAARPRDGAGRRWGMGLGIALTLVVAWGAARLFTPEPTAADRAALAGSAGLASQPLDRPINEPVTSLYGPPVSIKVRAPLGADQVTVRDRTGAVLFSGALGRDGHRTVVGMGPFTVTAQTTDVVSVRIAGELRGTLNLIEPTRTFSTRGD